VQHEQEAYLDMRVLPMPGPHDEPIFRPGSDLQLLLRKRCLVNHQAVVPGSSERAAAGRGKRGLLPD
jgi:hypothetical protein